jgi:DNA repair exonuclease SbcCD ATPase subunit
VNTSDINCARCNGLISNGSYIVKDGNHYHGSCLPMTSMLETANYAVGANIANITRLTGRVAELKAKLERQQAYHMDSRQELQEELSKSDAQRDEVQRMLTTCEEEKESLRLERTELFYDCETAENRVRVLESENAHLKRECGRLHAAGAALFETYRHGMTRDEQWRHLEALTIHVSSTPPAETPAASDAESPPDGYEFARMDTERDRLRAELADTRAQLDKVRHDCDEMIRTFDEVEAQRDAEESAHAATKAKLGRAVDVLRRLVGEHANAEEFRTIRMQADAILADADGKVKP